MFESEVDVEGEVRWHVKYLLLRLILVTYEVPVI